MSSHTQPVITIQAWVPLIQSPANLQHSQDITQKPNIKSFEHTSPAIRVTYLHPFFRIIITVFITPKTMSDKLNKNPQLGGGPLAGGSGGVGGLGSIQGTLGKATEGIGNVTGSATDGLTQTVKSTTEGVSNIAGSATEGVGSTVKGVTGALDQTVKGATGSLGQQSQAGQK